MPSFFLTITIGAVVLLILILWLNPAETIDDLFGEDEHETMHKPTGPGLPHHRGLK